MTAPATSSLFFNDTATTEIYTLSLHDALPISLALLGGLVDIGIVDKGRAAALGEHLGDRRGQRRLAMVDVTRSEEHTSELQSRQYLVCRLLLEKKKHHWARSGQLLAVAGRHGA